MVADINTHIGNDIDKSDNESIFHIFEIHLRKLLHKSAVVCAFVDDSTTMIRDWARTAAIFLTIAVGSAGVALFLVWCTPLPNVDRGLGKGFWCSKKGPCEPKEHPFLRHAYESKKLLPTRNITLF